MVDVWWVNIKECAWSGALQNHSSMTSDAAKHVWLWLLAFYKADYTVHGTEYTAYSSTRYFTKTSFLHSCKGPFIPTWNVFTFYFLGTYLFRKVHQSYYFLFLHLIVFFFLLQAFSFYRYTVSLLKLTLRPSQSVRHVTLAIFKFHEMSTTTKRK